MEVMNFGVVVGVYGEPCDVAVGKSIMARGLGMVNYVNKGLFMWKG